VPDDLVRASLETIPVDVSVSRGTSALDVGLLTSESRPIDVAPGSSVHAGTVNVAALIDVLVTAVGKVTRVGALVASIEALGAAGRRSSARSIGSRAASS